jgi:hypothetical protein
MSVCIKRERDIDFLIYVNIYICMCVCLCVCLFLCVFVSLCLCFFVSLCLCFFVSMFLCFLVWLFGRRKIRKFVCVYVGYVYINTFFKICFNYVRILYM